MDGRTEDERIDFTEQLERRMDGWKGWPLRCTRFWERTSSCSLNRSLPVQSEPCLFLRTTNRILLSYVQTCAVRPSRLFLPTTSERDETRGPDGDSLGPHYSPGYHVAPHYSSELGQIQENQHPLSDFPSYVYSPPSALLRITLVDHSQLPPHPLLLLCATFMLT